MSATETETTRVIFRKWSDNGEVFAILLDVPANPFRVMMYARIGQHGEGTWSVTNISKPAKPAEYGPLYRELEQIGYRLSVRLRRPSK